MSVTLSAPGSVALEGGGTRIEVVPALGGRVRSLMIGGREWLLPGGPLSEPSADRSPFVGAGWDECAPAAGAGHVPEWVKGVGGRTVPAGGEARLQLPEVTLRTADEGHVLACTWRGTQLPWTLTRTLVVRRDGVVEARYEASASGLHRIPFLWSALLLLPLGPRTRVNVPEATRMRVESVTGSESVGANASGAHQWPRLSLDATPRDLSRPWSLPRKACVRCWVDLPGARGMVEVAQDSATLRIAIGGEGVTHCGLVLDRAGTRDGSRRGLLARGMASAIVIRPSLGAPDHFTDAFGDWQSVSWLVPGEPRRWSLTFGA